MTLLPVILFTLLTGLAVGAMAYAVLLPRIAMEKNTEARLTQLKGAHTDTNSKRQARDRVNEVAKRRRTLQASLKAVEDKQKQHNQTVAKMSLERRIQQAGLSFRLRTFVLISIAVGFVAFLLALIFGLSFVFAVPLALAAGHLLPRWTLNHLRKRRHQKFIDEFANAVDVIVRGIKSGLPLNDTLRMVSSEAKEPVRSEFRRIVEAQQVGLSTSEAVERLYRTCRWRRRTSSPSSSPSSPRPAAIFRKRSATSAASCATARR